MEETEDAGFECEEYDFENVRLVMSEREKSATDDFLKSLFERVIVLVKKEMETEKDDMAEEEKLVLTTDEKRVIEEFLDTVFKRAVQIVRKELCEEISDTASVSSKKDDIIKDDSESVEIIEEETTETTYSIKRKISAALKQGFHLPGHSAPKVKPQPEVESSHSVVDGDKEKECRPRDKEIEPYEGFITYGGKNSRGEHIVYVDPMKAPQSHVVADHSTYLRLLNNLLTFTDNFIAENTNGSPFMLIYRCLDEPQSYTMRLKWMARLYDTLCDRYLEKLEKLIVYKPEIKLKVLVKICKPFLRRELSSKLLVITDPVSLAQVQCLPQVIQK